ncbi:MAG: VIT1/CCC1 transporter family protein [Candidatus Magasanikbacteria bacterium]|nr:VIT1/CCC1 transporter family protein [Candidatus Magasanikbacteria bacterium]
MAKFSRKTYALYVKNFIFGVEDSLVSTIGLISGVAITGVARGTIIITGIILIFVEATSMGIGSLLSEHTAEEYSKKKNTPFGTSIVAGSIMFVSYFLAGFIPLSPYLFLESMTAFWVSIVFSLVALFVLGVVSGKIFKINKIRKGLEMLLLGGLGVLVGVIVGVIVQNYLI